MVVLCFVSLFLFFLFLFPLSFFFFLLGGGGGGGGGKAGGGGWVSETPSGVEIHCSFASCSFSCLNTPTQLAFTNCLVPLFS